MEQREKTGPIVAPMGITKIIKSEIKLFLQTTTVKGIPKIVQSKRPALKLLWWVAVLLGAAVALYFFIKLLLLYVSGAEIMVIRKIHLDSRQSLSPTLTLCNLNPLGNTGIPVARVREYISDTTDLLQQHKADNMSKYLEKLLTTDVIFENLIFHEESVNLSDFLVTCTLTYFCDGGITEVSCKEGGIWDVFLPGWGKCVSFETSKYEKCELQQFTAILYLDSFLEMNLPVYGETDEIPFADAALLIISPPDATPNFDDLMIDLSAGVSTSVYLDVTKTTYLDTGTCTKEDVLPYVACVYTSIQHSFIQKCNCTDGAFPSNEHVRNGSLFCRIIRSRDSLIATEESLSCLRSAEATAIRNALDECPVPCTEVSYQATEIRVPWPHPSHQLSFWNKYIRNQSYSWHFQEFKEVYDREFLAGTSAYKPTHNNPITQNFLKVNARFMSDLITEQEHTLAMPFAKFIANMGGMLNLWIGISFITVIELLEVMLKIIDRFCCTKD